MSSVPLASLRIIAANNESSESSYKNKFNYASFKCSAMIIASDQECISTSEVLNEDKDLYMNAPCESSRQQNTGYLSFNVLAPIFSIRRQSEIDPWMPFESFDHIPMYSMDIELCSEIKVDGIALANYELFSGIFRHFSIWSSEHYPPDPSLHSSIIPLSGSSHPGNITCVFPFLPDGTKDSSSCNLYKNGWKFLGHFESASLRQMQFFSLPKNQPQFVKYIRLEIHTYHGNEYYCPISVFRVYGTTMMEEYKLLQSPSHQLAIKSMESTRVDTKDSSDSKPRETIDTSQIQSFSSPLLSVDSIMSSGVDGKKLSWTLNDSCPYLPCSFQVKRFQRQSPASWNIEKTHKRDQDYPNIQFVQGKQTSFKHGDNIFRHFTDRLKSLELNMTKTMEAIRIFDNEQRNFLKRIEQLATKQASVSIEVFYKEFHDRVSQIMLDTNRQWRAFSEELQQEQSERILAIRTMNNQTLIQVIFIIAQGLLLIVLMIIYWGKIKKWMVSTVRTKSSVANKDETNIPKSPFYHASVDLDDTGIIPGAEYHLSSDTINRLDKGLHMHVGRDQYNTSDSESKNQLTHPQDRHGLPRRRDINTE